MSSNYLANVPKLKGRENYDDWCFAAQNVLVLEGMAACIQQKLSAEASAADLANDAKAKAKLVLTIDPSLYVHIKQAVSAYELWNTLRTMFDDSGYTRKISLLRNLINIRLENCETMTQYVTQIVETGQRLQGTGFKITDEWIGALMLAGLPEKYAPMIMAIEHSGMEVSADVIKTKLMDMCLEVGTTSGSESAFIAKGTHRVRNGNPRSGHSQNHKQTRSEMSSVSKMAIKCFRCKQSGHYKNQCPQAETVKRKQTNAFNAIFLTGKFNRDSWYIDSGASKHMTACKHNLVNVSELPKTKEITIANQTKVPVQCSGDVNIVTVVNEVEYDVVVRDILYIPELTTNLLSVSQLIEHGNSVIFKENVCYIYNQQKELVGQAELVDGVYKLITSQSQTEQTLAATAVASSDIWHRRLGHINSDSLNKMKNGAVEGISFPEKANISKSSCIICCEGKQARLPFQHSTSKTEDVLEVIHADVGGPMEKPSIGQSRYYVLFVDDYSKMSFVYFMKEKSEVLKYFKEFQTMTEKQKGKKIKILRTDNGGEFCSLEFEKYLKERGIVHQKTNPYTPEQNGMCERLNRSVVEKARCLIFDTNLDKKFWAEAVNTSVYIRNRSVVKGLNNETPYQVWTGQKPDISHLRIFGSKVMVHIPKQRRLKWDRKSKQLILVGYAENVKGYRVYDPSTNSVTTSRDIIIMEATNDPEMVQIPIECKATAEENEYEEESYISEEDGEEDRKDETYVPKIEASSVSDSSESFFDTTSDSEITIVDLNQQQSRPKRVIRPPDRYGYNNLCIAECEDCNDKEITLAEALNGPENEFWRAAMKEELDSFEENEAWELVDHPQDSSVIQCKWVFKKKYDSVNNVRYRARLVAKGFSQTPGVDFHETFSPVLRYSTLRLLFALAAKLNLDISHLDVTTAFLNGFLTETVYMKKPIMFERNNNNGNDKKVLKLKRAIYGLKQSSRAWYQRVNDYLIHLGYKKSDYEPCLFTKFKDNVKIIIALFVDDFFVFSNCTKATEQLVQELSNKFKIKNLGQVKQCLGVRVRVTENEITLDQEQYVENLLKRFNMSHCKTAETPMEINLRLEKSENVCNMYPYQQLIGGLMYLAVLTRPDIAYSVSYLSQFNNSYNETHWKHAKRVLRYLKNTKNYGLVFRKDNFYIEGFVDADWGSDSVDRKSYSGYCFKLSNTVISFECRKQRNVALSSTEAEYISMSEASKEAIYLKNLLGEIVGKSDPIVLYNDCQSAQKLVLNPMYHRRSKHIDIRYHFVREAVSNNYVKISYLQTAEMPADILTKSLGSVKHFYFMKKLGILPVV